MAFWCLYYSLLIYLACCSGVFCWHWTSKWQMEYILYCLKILIHPSISEWDIGAQSHLRQSFMEQQSVNNSYQPLTVFCHKEFHIRCFIGIELNIIASTKILKGIVGHPSSSAATLGKYKQLTLLDARKMHFQRFFAASFWHLL